MGINVTGAIETPSGEISGHNAACAIEELDFSTPLRYGRNDDRAGALVSIVTC